MTFPSLQISRALLTYCYKDGGNHLNLVDYIPDAVYTSTRVELQDGSEIWAPHADAKVPGSAYGILVFVIHSLEMLRPFAPPKPWPKWWESWVLHVHLLGMLLRFSYSFKDLLQIEYTIISWQKAFFATPEFNHCWKPKHHWALHAAHDIWRWGPPRLLWCMLMEMKNKSFKLMCKRGNFHDPPKQTALFWAESSAYLLKHKKRRRSACAYEDEHVILQGEAASFDSERMQEVLNALHVARNCTVQILNKITLRGLLVPRLSYMLEMLNAVKLWRVEEIVTIADGFGSYNCYLVLVFVAHAQRDVDYGSFYVPSLSIEEANHEDAHARRLVSADTCDLVAVWHCDDGECCHFVIKW